MFLTVSSLFVCQIMEHSPTLCFADVNWKRRENKQKRSKKMETAAVFVAKKAKRTMLQPIAICRNKVQVKLQAEIESLLRQRVLCYDIAKEE